MDANDDRRVKLPGHGVDRMDHCWVNQVSGAIILWNTVYLPLVFERSLEEKPDLPDDIVRQISPQIWEHSNLTGIYDWTAPSQLADGFRSHQLAHLEIAEAA